MVHSCSMIGWIHKSLGKPRILLPEYLHSRANRIRRQATSPTLSAFKPQRCTKLAHNQGRQDSISPAAQPIPVNHIYKLNFPGLHVERHEQAGKLGWKTCKSAQGMQWDAHVNRFGSNRKNRIKASWARLGLIKAVCWPLCMMPRRAERCWLQ